MIPKVIHYCWFGRNKKSKLIRKCIASWRTYLPDFEIMEWNEDNFDINQNEYVKGAYEAKKWAFVSDYARMKILYENGGIYFDTDVEMFRPIPPELLKLKAFSGIEDHSKAVAPGLVFACEPHYELVKKVLDSYERDQFYTPKTKQEIKAYTINRRVTALLEEQGYQYKDELQKLCDITLFPSKVFSSYDSRTRRIVLTEDSICAHHYAASWVPWYVGLRMKLGTVKRRLRYTLGGSK